MRILLILAALLALGAGIVFVLPPSRAADPGAESGGAPAAADGSAAGAGPRAGADRDPASGAALERGAAPGPDAAAGTALRARLQARLLAPSGAAAAGAELRARWPAATTRVGGPADAAREAHLDREERAAADARGIALLELAPADGAPLLSAGGDYWCGLPLPQEDLPAAGATRDLGAWTLAPASRVVGRVLDPLGAPAAGARVELRRAGGALSGAESAATVAAAVADERGEFRIPGVAAGDYLLRADSDGCGASAGAPLTLRGLQEDVAAELRLAPGGLVTGRLRRASGGSLDLARVLLWEERPDAEAAPAAAEILRRGVPVAADGSFALRGADGRRLVLLAAAPDSSTERAPVTGRPIELTLHPRMSVRGTVLAGGLPAADAEVRLRPPGGSGAVARTGPDGAFVFEDVEPGPYQLWAAAAAGSCERFPLIAAPGLEDQRLELVAAPGLEVRVTNALGAPLADARVTVAPDDLWAYAFEGEWEWSERDLRPAENAAAEEGAPAPAAASGLDRPAAAAAPAGRPQRIVLVPRSARTGADGVARFADLPQGVWHVEAERAGYRPGEDLMDLDQRPARELTLALQPAGALRVLLADEDGRPVPGTRVQLLWRPVVQGEEEGQASISQRTDATGAAQWSGLAAADYLVRWHSDPLPIARGGATGENAPADTAHPERETRLRLESGESREIRLVARGAALATARIERGGLPLPFARAALVAGPLTAAQIESLRFFDLEEGAQSADGAGRVALPAVAPGSYVLLVRPGGAAPAHCEAVELRAGAQELRVALPAGSVRGRALGAAGALAGATVLLLPPSAERVIPELDRLGAESSASVDAAALLRASQSGPGCAAITDAEGRYRFETVPPGPYRVQIHAPPYAMLELPALAHDGKAALDLGEARLRGAGAIAGELPAGAAGSWIELASESGAARFAAADSVGRWLCDALEPGAWTIRVWPADPATPALPVILTADALVQAGIVGR